MATRSRFSGWAVIGALFIALMAVATFDRDNGPQNNAEREFSLAAQFACPVCDGQSIAESEVPIAREIRKEIRTRLDQGQTDTQIRQYLVGLYGDNIDLKPKASGVTAVLRANHGSVVSVRAHTRWYMRTQAFTSTATATR